MTTAATSRMPTSGRFWNELERRIGKYDLLCHPFYKAWSAGELTREELREYSADYYHHVSAFPTCLSALHSRLEDGELRRAVLRNLSDEEIEGTAHSELWLNFAAGMGADPAAVRARTPLREVAELISTFRNVAADASPAAALAAVYAYESQVPRVAKAKADGLKKMYGADVKTCGYFTLHQTADVRHAEVWREQLEAELERNPESAAEALTAAESAAAALWKALDGIERKRQARKAN